MHCCAIGACPSCICILLYPLPRIPHAILWVKFLKTAESLTSVTACHAGDPRFQRPLLLVKNKSYFYNINYPASSQLKWCTTRKRCQGNPPEKPTKLFFFFSLMLEPPWSVQILIHFPGRRRGGREGGEERGRHKSPGAKNNITLPSAVWMWTEVKTNVTNGYWARGHVGIMHDRTAD